MMRILQQPLYQYSLDLLKICSTFFPQELPVLLVFTQWITSKKDIGALNILRKAFLWNLYAAHNPANENESDRKNINIAPATPRSP